MQLTKYLQAQGIGSRKQCRQLVEQGRIAINGAIAETPAAEIEPAQVRSLAIDGEAIAVIPLPHYYILLHKPAGYETSHKPRDYPSIFSLLPGHLRATGPQAVGRLDADTTGVLLLTNDGAFNHRQTSPKQHVAKLYRATLKHPADESLCATLRQGVLLHDDNETVAAAAAELESPHSLLLTLTEGKYHQVKRMVAAAGNRVEALHRLRFGDWDCQGLQPGEWCFIRP
ncbi:rRNA pseudouridine synthase [Eikenella sp. S3360]|uniref:Pseudouridine synthase n=1 Tax=Eikenella glucosivorans TaxID=2766967 RepID=A0ABS0N7Y6_9NEIS|nr:pseudouridine synthase [Eikenella glucosivorans]MBH5328422.1 rRNA pseudouridine synthase [Eikenella glucosivorans]